VADCVIRDYSFWFGNKTDLEIPRIWVAQMFATCKYFGNFLSLKNFVDGKKA